MPYDRLEPPESSGRGSCAANGRNGPFTFAAMPQTSVGPSAAAAIAGFNLDKVKAEALHRKPIGGGGRA